MSSGLTRFGASVESDLLEKFDSLIRDKGYGTRSEVLRDLMRDYIVDGQDISKESAIGTITLVYDHHSGDLSERLTGIQHDYHDCIVSALHAHLDHHNCLEVIVVKGPGGKLQELADRLVTARGVLHGKLVVTSTEGLLETDCKGCHKDHP